MELMEAIKSRRSIRKYNSKPVSDENIEYVIEAARWAPSWANTQCVRWIIVRDPDVKAKLAGTLSETNPAYKALNTVPVVLVACAITGKSGMKKGEAVTDKGDWFMFDAALASQNLTLAAHELGLGTVHIGLIDAKRAQEILEVPEGVRVVEYILLGHPEEKPAGPGRNALDDIVFRDGYGKK